MPKEKTNKNRKTTNKNFNKKSFPKGSNDLKWYNNYPELTSGLLGANFGIRKGITSATSTSTAFAVPSVASLRTILTLGKSDGEAYKSAVDKLYASMRSANTGSVSYTKLELQLYLMNIRLALAVTRHLRRAYGVIKKFDLFDKTTPVSIFKAMGLDYDSFAENAANLRNELNYIAVKLHTLMPYKSDLTERTAWMFDNIFKDSNDAKAQLYLFSLDSAEQWYYDWNNASLTKLTSVTGFSNFANQSSATGMTYSTVISNLRTFISNILGSNTVQIIAADILKCYGTQQISYFEVIPENYEVNFVYSEEVLTQIQNARFLGGTPSSTAVQDTSYNVTVTGNYLTSEAHFVNPGYDSAATAANRAYINMYKNNISNLDLLGATRLTWTAHADANVTNRYNVDSYGTELLRFIDIVSNVKPYGDTSTYAYDLFNYSMRTFESAVFNTYVGIATAFYKIGLWTTFDWAPMIIHTVTTLVTSDGTITCGFGATPMWDFNNYALVEASQISTYHDIAIMSLMFAPSLIRNVNLLEVK